ncbi:MAG: asparagine synthase (glutamine-hydrolyzing) [Myxococcaceae bacterium]|nr:asparagine synthase (glutamine-hydrolyzing) [Myxococcaceae bacterium]
MCGISGIVGPGASTAAVDAMVEVQHHRGPDENGVWADPDSPVVLGHNRLRIIDLSATGRQPMASPDEQLWLVFNGEIYNYRELKAELSGYRWASTSDSEVIIAAYEKWGDACVDRFVGMFAFAIWDRRRQRLFCARDRMGVKPFVYAWHQGRFHFASEVKGLLAAGVPAEPDLGTWACYLVHSYTDHDDRTFFREVRSLPAAHTLVVEGGKATQRCYWNLPALAEDVELIENPAAIERFQALFDESLRLRLRSDVPLGVNLTGGLDSSALMVAADRQLADRGHIETFTALYGDPRYDEADYAADVPHRTEWRRNLKVLDAETAWELIPTAVWHQEAPFGAVATLGYHQLLQHAKERGITVLLEGQGVDELLAGYGYFRYPFYLDLLERGAWATFREEAAAAGDSEAEALAKARQVQRREAINVYQDGTSHLRPECASPDVRALAGPVPQFVAPFRDHLRNWLWRDFSRTKLPRVLRMNDHLSMAASRELRVPYLDHRLVEFAFRLPATARIAKGERKHLLRAATRDTLPDSIRVTPKRAVVTPQREWFQGPLRSRIEDLIASRSFRERGLFDAAEVARGFDEFCAGKVNNAFWVWQWINTELWFQKFQNEVKPA